MDKKIIRVLIASALCLVVTLIIVIPGARAANEETFTKILALSYKASCDDADDLRKYYLPEAEIIHDGRQTTLSETIEEVKRSLGGITGLACGYTPRVQGSYIEEEFAFLTLAETIHIEAEDLNAIEIRQLCTYIFLKKNGKWMITHDHCSEVEGQTV